ncbi:MAG: exodeoxyribonuclease VII large subunit [Clostridiaceae bacterium]|nr:exodeoxyribonuclease VII large subunit [Clostridiaceae bacterium]
MNAVVSVEELNRYVNQLISNDSELRIVRVRGEISNYKRYPSGHAYFQLKDTRAQVSCVMFKGQFSQVAFQPADGQNVILQARAGIYEQDGRFQLVVYTIQQDGIGDLFRRFELLKNKLKEMGLFDEERKRPLPLLPKRIGVITSPKGAVISDIIHVLSRRFPGFDLVLFPSAVQGASAANELINGIKYFNSAKIADVIIIARGGGSIEDLWCFNDERLALSIADSEIPIISAVGHETDFTICDFVADYRAPTPSAAAEIVMPDKSLLAQDVIRLTNAFRVAHDRTIRDKYSRLNQLMHHRSLSAPKAFIDMQSQRIDYISQKLESSFNRLISSRSDKYSILIEKLRALDPDSILSRGYAYLTNPQREIIDTTTKAISEPIWNVHMKDGTITVRINEHSPDYSNEE